MRANLRVGSVDGEQHVVAGPADFIRWERQYKRRTSDLATGWTTEDWAYIAWACLRRSGSTAATFDDWLATVTEVTLDSGDEPTPTQPGASAGSS